MKINISTNDLSKAISLGGNTLGSNSDITSHFVFVKDGKDASILSCSLPKTFTKVPLIGATVTGDGSFTMEGKRLSQAISAVSGDLEISPTEEGGRVNLKSEKGELELPSLDPSNFPDWLERLSQAEIVKKISSSVIYESLNALKSYVCLNESRGEISMCYFKDGYIYACDGYGMSVCKHESISGLDIKIPQKEISSLLKFLKSIGSGDVEILKGDRSYFFKSGDGDVFGVMDSADDFPKTVMEYKSAFDWTPQKVWGVTKSSLSTAIKFLRAGAEKDAVEVTFTDEGDLLPPSLSMMPSSKKGNLSYTLTPAPDSEAVSDGRKMLKDREGEDFEGEDFNSFKFNWQYMVRSMESNSEKEVFIGCNKESSKGYMVFKNNHPSGVRQVSVVGWING